MQRDRICPRCGGKKLWSIRRGKLRCSACRYEWTLGKLPLQLERREWQKLLHWFMRGLPARAIAQETGLHHQRVFRALTYVRLAMQKDIPDVFSGTVEVDETYLGGQWKESASWRIFPRGRKGPSAVVALARHLLLGSFAGVAKYGPRSSLM